MSKNKSKPYNQFLENKDFITWVLTRDDSSTKLWTDYIEQNPELENDFQIAINVLHSLNADGERLGNMEKKNLLSAIKESSHSIVRKKKRIRLVKTYAAIASIILVVGLSVLFKHTATIIPTTPTDTSLAIGYEESNKDIVLVTNGSATSYSNDLKLQVNNDGEVVISQPGQEASSTIKTKTDQLSKLIIPYGKRSQLKLADGTQIWLNSGTVLEFPVNFNGKEREITVYGEIYIEVAHDKTKPFIVHSKDMDVRVYGTKFNISTYANSEPSVVLAQGSVGVSTKKGKEVKISPSERIKLVDNTFIKEQVDIAHYLSWKDGYLLFDNTPMSDVLIQVGRYYNLTFNINNEMIKDVTCTGKIYLSSNFNTVMHTISLLTNTKYYQNGKNIYLNME